MRVHTFDVCRLLLLAATLTSTAAAVAQTQTKPKHRTAKEIVDAAPASAWRLPDPENLLYMDLAGGRVIFELAPQFAPQHVANIRALAKGGFWNGLAIYRSQDNFVVQFGDPDVDDTARRKPLPKQAKAHLPAEFDRDGKGLTFTALPDHDGWAPQVGFAGDFPAARDPNSGKTWLAHCYGSLGAGRDTAPDSSTGAELYVVIGQSPRQLDRNITLVGRVLKGMELLSTVPRGPEPMGMYGDPKRNVPITSIRLASDVPAAQRTPIQVLRTDTPTFAEATEARRNRRDGWYVHPAGHIDLCNVPLPVKADAAP